MDEAASKNVRRRFRMLIFALVVALSIAALGVYLWQTARPAAPLPDNVIHQTNLQLYYPSTIPKGYRLVDGSAHTDNGLVFFSLSSGSKHVSISEQPVPAQAPDFKSIQNFNTSFRELDASAGKSIVGIDVESHKPVGLLVTNTTLITISGDSKVPQDVITKLILSMSSL